MVSRDLEVDGETTVRIFALVCFIFDNQPLPLSSSGHGQAQGCSTLIERLCMRD